MDLEKEFGLEHLLFKERTCKVCGQTKDLIDEFYLTRKDRGARPSAYSYAVSYTHLTLPTILRV